MSNADPTPVADSGNPPLSSQTRLPAGLQAKSTAVHDDAPQDDDDDATEAKIFKELSLEILRRRLNTQMGKLRRKEKQLGRHAEEKVEQQLRIDEETAKLAKIEDAATATKGDITTINAITP